MPKTTQHVVYVSTNTTTKCEHCEFRIDLEKFAGSRLASIHKKFDKSLLGPTTRI